MSNRPPNLAVGSIVCRELSPTHRAVVTRVIPAGPEGLALLPTLRKDFQSYIDRLAANLDVNTASQAIMIEEVMGNLLRQFENSILGSQWDWVFVEAGTMPALLSSEGLLVVGTASQEGAIS